MKTTALTIVGVAVFGLVLFVTARGGSSTTESVSEKSNREVALTCTTDMATQFHIHSTLEILVNGEAQTIPANIGVQSACMNSLHTHTPDGLLHVESPEKRDFTLADFFAVWKQPLAQDSLLAYKTDDTHRIRVTVDGMEVDTLEDTVLKDNERIVIYYESI